MSIKYSGTVTRSAGLVAAIGKQTKLLNLKAAKRVTVTFDPFHEKAESTRWDILQPFKKKREKEENCTIHACATIETQKEENFHFQFFTLLNFPKFLKTQRIFCTNLYEDQNQGTKRFSKD